MTQNNQNKSLSIIVESLFDQTSQVIEQARNTAYRQVNEVLVHRNWLIGQLIAKEELKGEERAEYGASIIKGLSKRLTMVYGKGCSKSYLYSFVQFYKTHTSIFQSPIGKSLKLLSWTHYYILTQELNTEAREWYEKEAAEQNWSVRTLQRNVYDIYAYRRTASRRNRTSESNILSQRKIS